MLHLILAVILIFHYKHDQLKTKKTHFISMGKKSLTPGNYQTCDEIVILLSSTTENKERKIREISKNKNNIIETVHKAHSCLSAVMHQQVAFKPIKERCLARVSTVYHNRR